MSDVSQLAHSITPRPLRTEERELIVSLLSRAHIGELAHVPAEAYVTDMKDEGMGGIRFVCPTPRRFGRELARADYLDSDGVLVSISVNADDLGELFELDFWKVDLSPLKRYPLPEDLAF